MVLARQFSNSSPSSLERALRAYRRLDLARPPQKRPTRASKRAKRLNGTELNRLVERYASGATVYELATEFGIHRTTISQQLKTAGVKMRLQPLTPQQVEEAAALYATGQSLADVGSQLGVNASTVLIALRTEGAEIRKPWDHPRQHQPGVPSPSPVTTACYHRSSDARTDY